MIEGVCEVKFSLTFPRGHKIQARYRTSMNASAEKKKKPLKVASYFDIEETIKWEKKKKLSLGSRYCRETDIRLNLPTSPRGWTYKSGDGIRDYKSN